jgi:dihydroorotase
MSLWNKNKTILLRGGRLIDPALGLDQEGDLLIQAGRIQAVGANLGPAEEVFDARGLVICPGLCDIHVHFRTPGEEHKETMATGSAAAAAGGFTAVVCEPNTKPPLDSGVMLRQLQQKTPAENPTAIYLKGCLTLGAAGEELADIAEMKSCGAAALSGDPAPIENEALLAQALQQSRQYQLLPMLHAEDSGKVPYTATSHRREPELVKQAIGVAAATHAPVHFSHISTAEAAAALQAAKKQKLAVSAEVTPHHLALCGEEAPVGDANWKTNPPLRTSDDRTAVQRALIAGVIDCIATDHAPHTPREKVLGLEAAPFGLIGLETSLGVVLTTLYHSNLMALPAIIAAMSAKPRALLNLLTVNLAEGSIADLTLFDVNREWTVEPGNFHSKGRNCPFAGRVLKGRAVATIISGHWVMQEGEIIIS